MVYLLSFNTRTTINEVDDMEMHFIVSIRIGIILIFHFFLESCKIEWRKMYLELRNYIFPLNLK